MTSIFKIAAKNKLNLFGNAPGYHAKCQMKPFSTKIQNGERSKQRISGYMFNCLIFFMQSSESHHILKHCSVILQLALYMCHQFYFGCHIQKSADETKVLQLTETLGPCNFLCQVKRKQIWKNHLIFSVHLLCGFRYLS